MQTGDIRIFHLIDQSFRSSPSSCESRFSKSSSQLAVKTELKSNRIFMSCFPIVILLSKTSHLSQMEFDRSWIYTVNVYGGGVKLTI